MFKIMIVVIHRITGTRYLDAFFFLEVFGLLLVYGFLLPALGAGLASALGAGAGVLSDAGLASDFDSAGAAGLP